jgi:peptidoglycan/LPS O-acetylase OafA/YrhL
MVKRLLYLNGLAALGAVLNHSTAVGFIALIWWADRYQDVISPALGKIGSLPYYGLRLIEQGIIFAIPAFVFVSGYFIAAATGRSQKTVGWALIFARLRKLLIPFLLWCLLLIALDALQGKELTLQKIIVSILTGTVEPPYYYVPMIAQLFLLAPLLVPLVRERPKLMLAAGALLHLAIFLLNYALILGLDLGAFKPLTILNQSYLFTTRLFWFIIGLSAGFHLNEFKSFLAKYHRIFLFLAMAGFIAGFLEWEYLLKLSGQAWLSPQETLIDQIYGLGVIFAFLAFERVSLPAGNAMSSLGTRSFGVYLIHSPVLEIASKIIYHFVPFLLGYQIVFLPLMVAVGLAVPLVMMAVVNRSPARRFYEYIFG